METTKMSLDFQLKAEKDKLTKKDKELEKLKTERVKWETKAQTAETELNVSKEKVLQNDNRTEFNFTGC